MRTPREEPEYTIPDRHAPKGEGTTKYGDQINGSYKQPWVESDGVTDPHGDAKIG